MKERPILYSGPMVRAILEGKKTQTRRIMRLPGVSDDDYSAIADSLEFVRWQDGYPDGERRVILDTGDIPAGLKCPYGQPGDRLWVKETWNTSARWQSMKPTQLHPADVRIFYAADYSSDGYETCKPWRSPLFMMRWMSRITLEIVSVRVERLQEISDEDALAEGIRPSCDCAPVDAYRELWESINGPRSWAKNPWVFAVEFPKFSKGGAN